MRPALALPAVLAAVLATGACGRPDNAPGPGGVTVGEARALDEAAEMIESDTPPQIGTATVGASEAAR